MKPIIMSAPSNTQTMFEQMMMRRFRGKQEPVRFANRPAWLKAELLDKAAAKRKMRADKRLKTAETADACHENCTQSGTRSDCQGAVALFGPDEEHDRVKHTTTIDAVLYEELRASGRVDVSPGPDSIRPEKRAENETEVVK